MASLSWFEEALLTLDKMRSGGKSGGTLHLSYGNYRWEKATVRASQSHWTLKRVQWAARTNRLQPCQIVLLGTRAEVVSLSPIIGVIEITNFE